MTFSVVLPGPFARYNFLCLETVTSTNDYLKKIIQNDSSAKWIIFAEHQSQGRGQHGKVWHSDPGHSLTFSFNLRHVADEFPLTLMAGLCVHESVSLMNGSNEDLWLKWPNDVYAGEKKLAGILCESSFEGDILNAVVGIGVNLRPICREDLRVISLEEIGIKENAVDLMLKILEKWQTISSISSDELVKKWSNSAGRFWKKQYKFLDITGKKMQGRPVKIELNGSLLMENSSGRHPVYSSSLEPVI